MIPQDAALLAAVVHARGVDILILSRRRLTCGRLVLSPTAALTSSRRELPARTPALREPKRPVARAAGSLVERP